jgi:hypothetical protein
MERGIFSWCWRDNWKRDTRWWPGLAPQFCGVHQGALLFPPRVDVFSCCFLAPINDLLFEEINILLLTSWMQYILNLMYFI